MLINNSARFIMDNELDWNWSIADLKLLYCWFEIALLLIWNCSIADWESLFGEPSATTNTVFPPAAVPFTDNELGFVSPISRSFIRTVQHFITTFEKTKETCLQWDWAQKSGSHKN